MKKTIRTTIRFASKVGNTAATIRGGASSFTLEIPNDVAARIKAELGLGSLDLDNSRFPKQGNYYISPGFDNAIDRLDMDIKGGVSSVRIR